MASSYSTTSTLVSTSPTLHATTSHSQHQQHHTQNVRSLCFGFRCRSGSTPLGCASNTTSSANGNGVIGAGVGIGGAASSGSVGPSAPSATNVNGPSSSSSSRPRRGSRNHGLSLFGIGERKPYWETFVPNRSERKGEGEVDAEDDYAWYYHNPERYSGHARPRAMRKRQRGLSMRSQTVWRKSLESWMIPSAPSSVQDGSDNSASLQRKSAVSADTDGDSDVSLLELVDQCSESDEEHEECITPQDFSRRPSRDYGDDPVVLQLKNLESLNSKSDAFTTNEWVRRWALGSLRIF